MYVIAEIYFISNETLAWTSDITTINCYIEPILLFTTTAIKRDDKLLVFTLCIYWHIYIYIVIFIFLLSLVIITTWQIRKKNQIIKIN